MTTQDLTAFLAWALENEIIWDKDAIEIREGKHGLGIFAKKNLEAGFEAIQVPKSIVLSVASTGIANILEEEDIEGYVGLTLACMYELSRGSESLWSAYLALLNNRRPQMASDLSEESRELMKKSEVHADIETDLKDMREDYDNIVVPFLEKHADIFTEDVKAKFFSFEDFKLMTSHVSSRAMDVDDYHVSALIPFADFVNHSAEPNSDYLSHEDVCEVCGAISCEHLDEEDDEEEDDEDAPELEEKKAKRAAKSSEANGEDDDEDDEDWEDEEINDTCDIILDEDVKKGEEITRHYGPFPNKIFLSKYGFAEIGNPHDTVTIQLETVKKTAEAILGDSAVVEERVQWFLDTEDVFIGEDDEDDVEEDGCCGGDHDHDHDHEHTHEHKKADAAEEQDDDDEDEEEEEEEEEDFPRDIMYMMNDGSIDDRLLMLLNVIFMEKEQFDRVQASMEVATEYFNDIFLRRALEEENLAEEEAEEEDDEEKPHVEPLTPAGRQVRKTVLEAILQIIRLRADAFGVSDKTTAEEDLEQLKKANLSGPLYYGGVCVQGEKQILQNGLKTYSKFLADL
ncbi:N-lysine methyltransferase SETD6 [Entomortierella parvispora]|uniref:N-lysine methyltransferase SETD6 n=1 Tax=Entomortierella parvispora TaxID=205924 RepID=A0A9P3H982_9FUNG|nr:N-lysine methyltransferase SETD6 [Entomortierella parvispora]